nr:MAG: hypothetical protein 3 [Leviviridae sp.]
MKSHLLLVLDVYSGIFTDARHTWPTDGANFEKDLSYFRRCSEERGIAFFMLTLPAFCKVIERSLAVGSLQHEDIPQGIPHRGARPILLRSLIGRIFAPDGALLQEPCETAIFFLRQILNLFKKYRLPCPDSATTQALDDFFDIEATLPGSWPDTWEADTPSWGPRSGHPLYGDQSASEFKWDALRKLSRRVTSLLGTPDWWTLLPKHGPGVVSEQEGFISKYDFPNWPQKLGLFFPYEWFGSGLLDWDHDYSKEEPPSRLLLVPKTFKGPRIICCEPIAHQWMQQALWGWIEQRVRDTFLGKSLFFRDQGRSRQLAVQASHDQSLCTIDLSAASDRVSTRLVEYLLQGSEILDGLHACRSRDLTQNISEEHPKRITLKKFAPMGSATTFPIQSIVFLILTTHALRVSEGREDDWSAWKDDFARVTVFGDDIIAPNAAFSVIANLLTEVGLKVNSEKSFHTGLFRESCGIDAYNGVDVTPGYLLEKYNGSPSSIASTVECANNLFKKGLWHASNSVLNQVPEKELRLLQVLKVRFDDEHKKPQVPMPGDEGGLGLQSFCGQKRSHLRKRWNPWLQRVEYTTLGLTTKVIRERGTDRSNLTQYFIERPDPELPWEAGQVRQVRVRKARIRVP